MGYYFEAKGDYTNALKHVNEAEAIYKEYDDVLGKYRIYTFRINVALENNEINIGLQNVSLLISLAKELNNMNWLSEAYGLQAHLNEKRGDFEESYQQLKYRDSFNLISGNERQAEIEYSYKIRDTERELKLLKIDAELTKQRHTFIYTASICLLLLVTMFVLYLAVRAKNKKFIIAKELDKLTFEVTKQKEEFDLKTRQLTSKALHISERNELLEDLLKMVKTVPNEQNDTNIRSIERKIKLSLNNDKEWDEFKLYFEEINPLFFEKIKSLEQTINERELRMLSFIKIGLSIKEIANLLHIESNSVKTSRYRLKKKFGLEQEQSLQEFVANI
jgi:DNA-binding CsgD family transcriptional regulator